MWLFNREHKNRTRTFGKFLSLAIVTLMFNSCSDISVHQLDKKVQNKLQMIAVRDISTRSGQLYTRELRRLFYFGGKTNGKYKLTTKITGNPSSTLGVNGAGSTLKKMSMAAKFTLYDDLSGEILIKGYVISDATLGTVTSLYGQEKAETHAQERLAILLAQRVVRRLQLYFLENNH